MGQAVHFKEGIALPKKNKALLRYGPHEKSDHSFGRNHGPHFFRANSGPKAPNRWKMMTKMRSSCTSQNDVEVPQPRCMIWSFILGGLGEDVSMAANVGRLFRVVAL